MSSEVLISSNNRLLKEKEKQSQRFLGMSNHIVLKIECATIYRVQKDWIHTITTGCGSKIWNREDWIHAFTTGCVSKIQNREDWIHVFTTGCRCKIWNREDWIHAFTTGCISKIRNREDWIHAFTTGYRNKIWNNFLNVVFSQLSPILEKKNKSIFSWLAQLFIHFFIKIQPNMSEQEKKQQKIYDLLNINTQPKKFPK